MRILSTWLLFVCAASGAEAQCAMCGAAAPYAGSSPERTAAGFAVASLVLLVPVFALLTALILYLWRWPAGPAGGEAPSDAPADGAVDGAAGVQVLSSRYATSPGEAAL